LIAIVYVDLVFSDWSTIWRPMKFLPWSQSKQRPSQSQLTMRKKSSRSRDA
jgi:hypothetical protein